MNGSHAELVETGPVIKVIFTREPVRGAADGQELRRQYREHHLLYDEFESIEKPIFLAAQGPCLGAGLELACSCDFRFAARGARFQLPEIALGVSPAAAVRAGSRGSSARTGRSGSPWPTAASMPSGPS